MLTYGAFDFVLQTNTTTYYGSRYLRYVEPAEHDKTSHDTHTFRPRRRDTAGNDGWNALPNGYRWSPTLSVSGTMHRRRFDPEKSWIVFLTSTGQKSGTRHARDGQFISRRLRRPYRRTTTITARERRLPGVGNIYICIPTNEPARTAFPKACPTEPQGSARCIWLLRKLFYTIFLDCLYY